MYKIYFLTILIATKFTHFLLTNISQKKEVDMLVITLSLAVMDRSIQEGGLFH